MKDKLIAYFSLLRIREWYKNLVIFLPTIFDLKIFDEFAIKCTLIGLVALCTISSANYIINDILDISKDKIHPEKRKRPLASGIIKIWEAIFIFILLAVFSIYVSYSLSAQFAYFVIALLVLGQIYNLVIKKIAFADILLISSNFVIRAISGAYVIIEGNKPYIWVSPWLILCPFFLALFLAASKRHGDLMLLSKKAKEHKEVFSVYTLSITNYLMVISTSLLIISYSLYSFLSKYNLLFTLPFALFSIFRYFYLVESGSQISRHPELFVRDRQLVAGGILWVISVLVILYY